MINKVRIVLKIIQLNNNLREENDANLQSKLKISPSFRIAMIKTMNGAKSNFHIRAINMKPNCHFEKK